jgi:drug/metabolite transporter (DMT)-like permease
MGWVYFWALNFIWVGAYFVVDNVTNQLDAVLLTWMRLSLTATFILLISPKVLNFRNIGLSRLLLIGVSSFFSHVIPFTLLNVGQRFLNPAVTTLVISATPLFVILLRISITPKSASLREIVPVLIGLYGIYVLSDVEYEEYNIAIFLVLGAAASYAIAMRVNTRISHRENIFTASFIQTAFSSLLLLPYVSYSVTDYSMQFQSLNTSQWLFIISVLGGGGALGAVVYFKMLQSFGPEKSSYITYTIPIISGIFGIDINSLVWLQNHGG